jgi:hypothetical protein
VICLLIPPQHSSKLSEFPFKMPEKKQDYWIPESIKDVQFEERYTILTELGKYESVTCKVHVGNHFYLHRNDLLPLSLIQKKIGHLKQNH